MATKGPETSRPPTADSGATRPVIKILVYTDDIDVALDAVSPYGIGVMRDLAVASCPFFAVLEFDLLHRHTAGHRARNKLTSEVLEQYDELWIFGFLACDLPDQPENELTRAEVAALADWMNDGGVLISGEHANPPPDGADPGLPNLLTMGRAIGRGVPRAGRMRTWHGPPDTSIEHSFNTHEPNGDEDLHDLSLQADHLPQQLILRRFSHRRHLATEVDRTLPHPIFHGRYGLVTAFPDHQHEGGLAFPASYPDALWPIGSNGQPVPYPVASGVDKRTGEVRPVVSVYDGSQAGVGRIVADTSWHHFINVNLWGFRSNPVLDSLGSFFSSLALWLAPVKHRLKMREHILLWLAHHPVVEMTPRRHPPAVVGRTCLSALRTEVGDIDIMSILSPFPVDPSVGCARPAIPDDLVLGTMIQQLRDTIRTTGQSDVPASLVASTTRRAVTDYAEDLAAAAGTLRDLLASGLTAAR